MSLSDQNEKSGKQDFLWYRELRSLIMKQKWNQRY